MTDITPWLAFFSEDGCALLEAALLASAVEVPALVKLELLGNPMGERERRSLEELLATLPTAGVSSDHFVRAGRLKAELAGRDIFLSARDAHVVQCALDRNAVLISIDSLLVKSEISASLRVQMW